MGQPLLSLVRYLRSHSISTWDRGDIDLWLTKYLQEKEFATKVYWKTMYVISYPIEKITCRVQGFMNKPS